MLNNICKIEEIVDLTPYNTYKIKTSTKYMAFPHNKEEVIELIKYLKDNNIKYFLLGNGSNVILPDKEYDGVIITFKEMNEFHIDGNKIYSQAGAMIPKVALDSVDNNLKGLEWATGIPGTIGGSIVGNAGAYLHEIMEFVETVDVLDENLNFKTLTKDEIKYDYRTTVFKETKKYIILGTVLKLENGNKEESLAIIADRLKRRQASQPLEYPSAGSVFRNPSKELPAGKLIEDAALKGKTIGGAQISDKHANFIINIGNAAAKDVVSLIDLIKKEIKEKNDIELKCEQEIVEWD